MMSLEQDLASAEEELQQYHARHARLCPDEWEELHWLAKRWCPDSEHEAHAEMAMRMGELVLQFFGERSRGMAPRYGSTVRATIERAEQHVCRSFTGGIGG